MTIYVLNILSLFIWKLLYTKIDYDKDKLKKIIIFCIFLQFTIIQGCRSFNIGSDTLNYVKYYQLVCDNSYSYLDMIINPPLNFEIGWLWMIKTFSLLNLPPRIMLFLVALIINGLVSLFIYRESDDFIMSYWIFIGIEFFTLSFTMLRQMIAIGFILLTYSYYKREDKLYILFFILAICFHKTAMVFLIFIFIDKLMKKVNININFKKICLSMLIFYICVILFGDILLEYAIKLIYPWYAFTNSGIGFLWIVMLCILGLLLFVYKIEEKSEENRQLLIFIFIIFFSSIFQYMSSYFILMSRVALYFYVFTIIILPYISTLIKNIKYRHMYCALVYFLTFTQYILFSMNVYNLVPYSMF